MMNAANKYSLIYVPEYEYYSDKINGFLNLPEGWNHGEGSPPVDETIEKALDIANYAYHNFLLIDSAPGLGGEIQIALYHTDSKDDQYIECTFEKSGDFNVTLYKKIDNKWNVVKDYNTRSLEEIKIEIDTFMREIFLCRNISEYSRKDITIGIWEDLQAWHSEISGVEYLLFEDLAFQTQVIQYAGT